MRVAIIIPARWESKRLPGKPLMDLNGKPLIQWTYEAAVSSYHPACIATDDKRIADAAKGFGANVIMTDACENGTERCADANQWVNADLVVNWQGDSPLIPSKWPGALIRHLIDNPRADVATPSIPASPHPGMVRVEADHGWINGFARCDAGMGIVQMHVGMYAYWASALRTYASRPQTAMERQLGLEQLRWHPGEIALCPQRAPPWELREVNVSGDTPIVADVLRRRHEAAR